MADVYEKDLAQKSSLTTSDFIRVVGSDNVSYKQRVDNVKSALGIGALASYGSLASFYAEFASMAVFTKYFVTFYDDCATALGLPQGTYKGYVSKTTATLADITVQRYGSSGTNEEYIGRATFNSSGAVTASNWTKQPTRAEVLDKISYTTAFNVTQGTGDTYLYADRVGRTLFLEMVFRPASDVAQYATIAHINNISNISRTHWSTVTHTGEPVRLVLNTNGTIQTENAIGANKWVATSCTALMNAI